MKRLKLKRKFGILNEFKEFITRGNVLDLAVGMIIGAAFTAIVSALVNGIFKPLINAIPIGDMSGLITMLVTKYDAEGAVDMAASVYINWGEFLMAIINFLLTAVILFLIIKAINAFRDGMGDINRELNFDKAKVKELKAQGMTRKQIRAYFDAEAEKLKKEAEAKAAAEAPEPTDKILADIRELLKALAPEQAKKLAEEAAEEAAEAAEDK